MKFNSPKAVLLEALQTSGSAIPNKTTLQVLNNFLLVLNSDRLIVTATDLDMAIIVEADVSGEEDGSIVVNARKLLEIVRELPELPVAVSVQDSILSLSTETGFHCKLTGFDASEYPTLPSEENLEKWSISKGNLKFLYEKSAFAVSNDFTTRVSLTGVYWEPIDEGISMIGTDGHRLGKSWRSTRGSFKKGVIVPPRALNHALKTSSSDENEIVVEVGEATIKFACDSTTVYSKLIEGPYPDYEKVVPKELSRRITANREELMGVVRRVGTMAHSKTRQIKFAFEPTKLVLSAQNQDLGGDSQESLPIKMEGKPLSVGFNASYVLEVLRLIHSEEVNIELNSNLGATIFRPSAENAGYFFIVMPLRLLDEE